MFFSAYHRYMKKFCFIWRQQHSLSMYIWMNSFCPNKWTHQFNRTLHFFLLRISSACVSMNSITTNQTKNYWLYRIVRNCVWIFSESYISYDFFLINQNHVFGIHFSLSRFVYIGHITATIYWMSWTITASFSFFVEFI